MSAESKPELPNAQEHEVNSASAPAGSTPEAEVTPTVANFRKGFMKDSQFEVLMGMGEGEYRQMMESLLEDLQPRRGWRAIWSSKWARRFGGCGAPSASVTAWRSRTSECRVRTWRRRCDPPRLSTRWNPLSALAERGRPRCLRKRR